MKNFIYLSVLFLCCISFSVQAQTEVSGGIFEPTTWEVANSPYIVIDDVVIFPDASLTIEPGTEIRFATDTKLELRSGDLYALGTEDARITFTLDSDSPASSEKWKGIESTTPDTDSITIQLDYITVEFAEIGIFYTGGGNYREVNHANFNNNNIGIHCGYTGYEWVTISNSEFTDNTIGTEGRVSLINSTASGHDLVCSGLYSFSNGSEGARLTNCTFTNNQAVISTNSYILTSAYVENSTFIDNEIIAKAYRWEAKNSTFQGSSTYAIEAQTGTIDSCLFIDNAIGFQTFFAPYELTLTNNEFFGNDYGIWLEGPGADISNNTICGSNIYDAFVNTAEPVDISNNCWCTANVETVAEVVFDAYDDVSAGIATYEPISVACFGELLFPGDGNNDGQANAWDVLPIGVHYGSTGIARESQTTVWSGQEVEDWSENMLNGLNLKHSDTDGNGEINEDDILIILDNYGNTHTNTAEVTPIIDSENTYNLTLLPEGEIIPNSAATFNLEMENVEDLYGIAFAVQADVPFYQAGSFSLNLENSFLGTDEDLMVITKEYAEDGRVEIGIVRKDGQPITGGGILGQLDFVMIEDLIVSSIGLIGGVEEIRSFDLGIEDIEAVTPTGLILTVESTRTEITITDTSDINIAENKIRIFPNPVSDALYLTVEDLKVERIEFLNHIGQQVLFYKGNVAEMNMAFLAKGVYLVRVVTDKGIVTRKLIKE